MIEFLSTTPVFGVALTLGMFCLAVMFNRRWPSPFTTPLFLGTVFVVIILLLFQIPYSDYNNGAKYITFLLTPVTVCFAVPMYRQLPLLRRNALPILFSVAIGCAASIFSVILICIVFGLSAVAAKSLVSISTTTAIAIGITGRLGGNIALTTSAVVITGILGASVSDVVCRVLRLTNPVARGLAIGNASHAAGTVRAMQMGPVEGSLSSLAIVLSGLITAVLAPLAIHWLF